LAEIREKERRKVQISGKSSCMVALPKKWVKEMGLQQGSEILITRPSLSSLLITAETVSPATDKDEAIIEVTDKDSPDSLFRQIVSLYILGYNRISLRGGNGFLASSKRDAIKDMVRRHLIGTEGVVDSKEKMTVHVLLGYSELSVDNALKRMLLIASSMYKDAILALEKGDRAGAEGITSREDEVGRFGLYVIRQLNMSINQGIYKESILEPRDLLGYTQVAKSLEKVAYHAVRIASEVADLERPIDSAFVPRLVSMSSVVGELLDEAMLALFKRDHNGADSVVDRAKKFTAVENDPMRSLQMNDTRDYFTMHLLVDSQRRIAEYAREISEIVLDLTIERVVRKENAMHVKAV
jgi:phosphate uptake regulator